MKAAFAAAYWTAPTAICIAIYWLGLKAWFHQDDFAWLNLYLSVSDFPTLMHALFAPMAQGTIRPWSERLFFLAFYDIFGLDALPFRVWVFITQAANLVLLASVVRRVTGSRHAGLWAPVLWTVNTALAVPLSWTSAYNQVLCAFFLLLAFDLLLRHIETGDRRYWFWQWAVFLLGFGALEINVVYPALAVAYTLCCARSFVKKALWLFVASGAYTALHMWIAPKETSGSYAMYFDGRLFETLGEYLTWAAGPIRLTLLYVQGGWLTFAVWATGAILLALAAFAAWQISRRRLLAAFFIAWFLILIAPVLPLRDHVTGYYVMLPAIGFAGLGAWAFATAWSAGWRWRTPAIAFVAVYLACNVVVVREAVAYNYQRSQQIGRLVWGVEQVSRMHPRKAILLTNISSDLFWGGVFDRPFRMIGASEVYLAPGSEGVIEKHPELGDIMPYILPPGAALRALDEGRAVVYAFEGGRLRNKTTLFHVIAKARWTEDMPQRVDAGEPLFAAQMGPEWYEIESGFRWMPKKATVKLGGPKSAQEKLHVSGFCAGALLEKGPVSMTVMIDGLQLDAVKLEKAGRFDASFVLPPQFLKAREVTVAVEVDRVHVESGGGRPLGAAFGSFSIH